MLRSSYLILPLFCAALSTGCSEDSDDPAPESAVNSLEDGLSFFVTSETHPTGDLGGIAGADATCERLATAVGAGGRTWRAYLSAEDGGNGQPVNAGTRIGDGPWINANGMTVAADPATLHARKGDAELFVDENGDRINGQWTGSPMPVQHDVLTGSTPEGNVATGFTCAGWTSAAAEIFAKVGHSDGLGPMMSTADGRDSWNSAHDNGGCNDTNPRGGSGRFYCFAAD